MTDDPYQFLLFTLFGTFIEKKRIWWDIKDDMTFPLVFTPCLRLTRPLRGKKDGLHWAQTQREIERRPLLKPVVLNNALKHTLCAAAVGITLQYNSGEFP